MPSTTHGETRFGIGRFSRLTGLSVKTLRYYDEVGLLEPAHVDHTTRYRSYSQVQLAQARMLCMLRNGNVPINAMQRVLQDPTHDALRKLYDEHITKLEGELDALQGQLSSLRRLRQQPVCENIYEFTTEQRDPRPFLFLRYRVPLYRVEPARESAISEVRSHLARLRIEPTSPPCTYSPPQTLMPGVRAMCDVLVGFETHELVPGAGRIQSGWTPGGLFYRTRHYGLYEHLGNTLPALRDRLYRDNFPADGVRGDYLTGEVYRVGPWDTADCTALMTDVLWLIRPESRGSVTDA